MKPHILGQWLGKMMPSSCLALIELAAHLIHQSFQSRCLDLNYTSGKTELVCSPVGVGDKKANLDICNDPVLKMVFLPDVGSAHTVGCVPAYEHLGSLADMSASLLPDINRRLGQAGSLIKGFQRSSCGPQRPQNHLQIACSVARFG